MLSKVIIEENSPERFQAQVFEYTMAVVLAVLTTVTVMAGVFNIQDGNGTGAVLCFLIGIVLGGIFLYFVGVRRMTIDRLENRIHLTTRTPIREKTQDIPLSEVERLYFRRNSNGHVVDVEPGEAYRRKWIYGIGLIMKDGQERELYNIAGTHVHTLGNTLFAWFEAHDALTGGPEAD